MISLSKKILAGVIAAATALLLCGGLMACTAEEVQEPAEVEETIEQRIIGKPSEDALELLVENATGSDIVEVAIKESSQEEYGDPLITKKDTIEDGETVLVYIPQSVLGNKDASNSEVDASDEGKDAAESASQSDTETDASTEDASSHIDDIVLRTLYNIELTLDDDTVVELHNINLDELDEVAICLSDDGLAYIEYENDKGKKESTLETERALKEAAQAEAEAAAAAEAQAQAEAEAAAAQAQAEAEAAAAASVPSYQYDYGYSSGDTGSYSGSQSEGSCVDPNDLVFN